MIKGQEMEILVSRDAKALRSGALRSHYRSPSESLRNAPLRKAFASRLTKISCLLSLSRCDNYLDVILSRGIS